MINLIDATWIRRSINSFGIPGKSIRVEVKSSRGRVVVETYEEFRVFDSVEVSSCNINSKKRQHYQKL